MKRLGSNMDKHFTSAKYFDRLATIASQIASRFSRGNVRSQLNKELTDEALQAMSRKADKAMKRINSAFH